LNNAWNHQCLLLGHCCRETDIKISCSLARDSLLQLSSISRPLDRIPSYSFGQEMNNKYIGFKVNLIYDLMSVPLHWVAQNYVR
uniref:Transposase n=2 Tax=Parascaris univalens TaxID=6257 RepID=A0A915BKK5_PARUN